MSELQQFQYGGQQVRTVTINDEPWWVLKDVCDILHIANSSDVYKRLDDDERGRFNLGRQGEANVISESGLYSVILRSDKPEAKPFRKWVTNEVLPSIRKTGGYQAEKIGIPIMRLQQRPVFLADSIALAVKVQRQTILYRLRSNQCFTEPDDYIMLKGEQLKIFKLENPNFQKTVSNLYILTRQGALKMLRLFGVSNILLPEEPKNLISNAEYLNLKETLSKDVELINELFPRYLQNSERPIGKTLLQALVNIAEDFTKSAQSL